jgi:hypothetical protein
MSSGTIGAGVMTCLASGAIAAELAHESRRSRVSESVSRARQVIGGLLTS